MKAEPTSGKPRRSAYAAAVALLAMREHSRMELEQKLGQRDYPADEIHQALDAMLEAGLLSDERAASARIVSGLRRGHGPARIRQSLQQAGLPADSSMTGDDDEAINWIEQARDVAERKFGTDAPVDYQEWARRARFLQSRGYDTPTIRKALPAVDSSG
ncbi:MAG: regulatory protein RecX [Lysobacterales bacterium]